MGDTWDDEDFEPQVLPSTLATDKWVGEDEEEDVKECWEDEEEEKKDEEKKEEKKETKAPAPSSKSKSKKLAEKLAEKEEASLVATDLDLLDGVGLSKEEILRRRKLQEETDLKVALETLGVTTENNIINLDSFNPTTKQEFDDFQTALVEKISLYRDKEEFPEFVTNLVKNICLHLNSYTLKSLKGNVENLFIEKQKLEKGDKSKKPGKGKGKAKLTMETNISHMTKYGFDTFDDNEYDDFM